MDPRKCSRVRKLDEYDNLAHCVHVSNKNRHSPGVWSYNDGPLGLCLNENEKCNEWPSYLAHYGVKGQKWGVITKEYEPVAIDRRKTKNQTNIIQKARIGIARQREIGQAEQQQIVRERQARREKRKRILRTAGTVLGLGGLALALYKGYKMSDIHLKESGRKALDSLIQLKPTKNRRRKAFSSGFMALDAKERSNSMGLKKVGEYFSKAGSILTMSYYRRKIKNARKYIDKLKSFKMNAI